MTKAELESMRLSELHALAAEAGVEGFRKLRREELLDRLNDGGDGGGTSTGRESNGDREGSRRSRRERSSRGRARGSRDRNRDRDDEDRRSRKDEGRTRDKGRNSSDGSDEDAPDLTIRGPLEIGESGEGTVHGEQGEKAQVTAAQIRRCELREGDLVEGPAKSSRRGERRLSLVRVEKVNGADPQEDRGPEFESLTAVTPTRRIPIKADAGDVLTRAADLLAPLAFGQRVLVTAERRSGRSSLLRGLAKAILAGGGSPSVIALLVDERPEEVSEWRGVADGTEIVDAGADLNASGQLRRARLALAAAKRRAESGEDVVLIIDSLSRLAVAAGEPSETKPFFGAGRDLAEEGSGSLTVIATVFKDDEAVLGSVVTTESTSLELSAALAADGIVPALTGIRPSVGGEELLREGEVLAAARKLRAELLLLPSAEASKKLAERISATESNDELLR